MKLLTRTMAMGGLGLLAALAVGAGPAQAVATESSAQVKASSSPVRLHEGVQVAGFYQTFRTCDRAGRFGERSDNWDSHGCSPVRLGPRSGAWALQVASHDNWGRRGFDKPLRAICAFPDRYRPVWMGQYRPGRPGRVHRQPGRVIQAHPGRVAYSNPGPTIHEPVTPGH